MKIIETIKQRQHRPALIIAGLMLVYLWFFSWPNVARLFQSLWAGLHFLADGGVSQCLWALTELTCVLAGVAIWILSVFVTWAAFRKSRKRAYIFILAYLLLPLVVQPASRLIDHLTVKQRLEAYERLQAAGDLPPAKSETPQPYLIAERKVIFPAGPLLLLAGIWYLYKKEKRIDDEPTTGEYSHVPRETLS